MKISAILLAAGKSTRFGENKLLTEINSEQMYMHCVKCLSDIDLLEKIIVTQYDEIEKALHGTDFKVIRNSNPELGLSHSVSLGINGSGDADAYLFLVCDQPYLKRETVVKLIEKFIESDRSIACVKSNNRTGNPCIFSKTYKDNLLSLTGDCGGKQIINENKDDVLFVEVNDEKELEDIDTK